MGQVLSSLDSSEDSDPTATGLGSIAPTLSFFLDVVSLGSQIASCLRKVPALSYPAISLALSEIAPEILVVQNWWFRTRR